MANLGLSFNGTNENAIYNAPNYEFGQAAHTWFCITDRLADTAWMCLLSAETNTPTGRIGVEFNPGNNLAVDNTFSGSDTSAATAVTFTAAGGVYFCGYRHPGGTAAAEFFYAVWNGSSWGSLAFKAGNGTVPLGSTAAIGSTGRLVIGEFAGGDDLNGVVFLEAIVNSQLTQAEVQAIFDAKSTTALLAKSPGWCVDASNTLATDLSGNGRDRTSLAGTSTVAPDAGLWTFGVSSDPSVQYVGAGAAATAASGNVTPAYPGSLQADDILLCEVTSNDNVSVSFGGTGWTKKVETNNGTGLRQTIAWKRRATGDSDTNVVITHTAGGRIAARVHALRNARRNGDPFEDSAVNTPSAAATGTFPNVTTTVPLDLMIYGLSYGNDFTTGPAITNAQGLTLTERDETEVT